MLRHGFSMAMLFALLLCGWVQGAFTYHYDLAGQITRKGLPNGTETRCTFDAMGRKLSESTVSATGTLVSGFDYSQPVGLHPSGYDSVGNLLRITESYATLASRTVDNVYDRVYRLDSETIVDGSTSTVTDYAYDKGNNRTVKSVAVNGGAATVWTSTYGSLSDGYNSHQLKSVSDGSSTTTFSYDLNGNRSAKAVDGVTTQTYVYDGDNRLVSLSDATRGDFHYTYDHRSRRVARDEVGSATTAAAYAEISFSGGLSVQERASRNSSPDVETVRGSDYGGGIGGVLYTIRGSARSYNAYNSRGDVVSQTADNASVTWQAAYEAFGTRTAEQGSNADRQRANTKDEDPTGLLNEGMRYRDLEFGVFITRDPAGFVDGPNVYTYVRQNPWTMFDPLGLAGTGMGLRSENIRDPEFMKGYNQAFVPSLIASIAAPVLLYTASNAPAIAAWAMTPAGVATSTDVAISSAEVAAGIEGPGIPTPGDLVKLPAQAAIRNSEEIVEVAGNTARGIMNAMEEVVEQIFYRGSKPGKPVDFTPSPSDFKVDPDGFVKPTHGLSVFDNAESVSSKGFDPHKIDPSSVSEELRIIQRGKDPAHYEIVPKPDVKITPSEYAEKLGEIQTND